MKAHRIALPILAATALLTTGTGVALADEPTDCATAVTALNAADSAHRDAVAADDALAKAEDNDQALKDARRDLKDAEKKRDVASADVTAKQAEVDRLNGDKADDPATPEVEGPKVGTPEQIAAAQTALDQAKKTLKNREDRVADRQKDVDRAERAARPEVQDLRRKANRTDASELQKALDAARDDFNRLCTEGEDPGDVTTTEPAPEPAPADPADVDDSPQVVTVPKGGVQTGGWLR